MSLAGIGGFYFKWGEVYVISFRELLFLIEGEGRAQYFIKYNDDIFDFPRG